GGCLRRVSRSDTLSLIIFDDEIIVGIAIGSIIGIILVFLLIAIVIVIVRVTKRRRTRTLKYLKPDDDHHQHLNASASLHDRHRPTKPIQI
ncbi:unnamed protein product, partial [Rotaria sp. Silwood1]